MKARLCFALLCCILLSISVLPTSAGDPPALTLTQPESAEPGQDVTLILSLPDLTLAGGFVSIEYDTSLFLLKSVQLLQATDTLTLTYHDNDGSVNVLLDAAQNVQVTGNLLSLTFYTSEETQPGAYLLACTVPDAASFYALDENGSSLPLNVSGCAAHITLSAPILPTCPARYLACQETNPINDKLQVRLCALISPDATLSKGSYGFTCSITDAQGTRSLTLGGSEILDQIEGGDIIYTASDLGGSIYTATLSIPATGEVSITLTPYVRLDNQTLYAGTYTLLYQDGAYVRTVNG